MYTQSCDYILLASLHIRLDFKYCSCQKKGNVFLRNLLEHNHDILFLCPMKLCYFNSNLDLKPIFSYMISFRGSRFYSTGIWFIVLFCKVNTGMYLYSSMSVLCCINKDIFTFFQQQCEYVLRSRWWLRELSVTACDLIFRHFFFLKKKKALNHDIPLFCLCFLYGICRQRILNRAVACSQGNREFNESYILYLKNINNHSLVYSCINWIKIPM